MSLVLEAILKWESFDAELLIIAGAGLMKIGDIVSDLLFTKELSEFNSVFHDLDGEEVQYRPPITELMALSLTFTIIGILFDLYKGYYAWNENREKRANETGGEKHSRKLELVKHVKASFPFMLLQRMGLEKCTVREEESKSEIEENDETSVNEAVAVVDDIDKKNPENKTDEVINTTNGNDSCKGNDETSNIACEDNQNESKNDIESENEEAIEEIEDEWKWWKRLNLIFEEIPQLMILIFFYQKVILVRDCDSVKEKIERLCGDDIESRLLYSGLPEFPCADDISPVEIIGERSIPKIIIQMAPNDPKLFDPQWSSFQAVLREMNPDFDFYLFDDDEALQFIDDHFENTALPDIYRNAQKPVMQADLFRLASVSVLGGFYMDMDMLAKQPFDPIVDAGFGAVFPRELKKTDSSFISLHFKLPTDEEDLWQVGNYAFGAVPNHPFVVDALKEGMGRCQKLINSKTTSEVSDFNVLHATGQYMLTEVYHKGRKNGKYGDVHHLWGDDDLPSRTRFYGDNNWHKFGPYAEHMLSHTWVNTQRKLNELYSDKDPFVKPIIISLQLSDYPEYVEWSIKSVDGNVTYAQYNQGTYNSNQSSTNVTNVVYVHPNVPLEFSYYESLPGISSYALFEGDNVNQGKELAIDRATGGSGSFSAFFTLPEETLAPTPAPSRTINFERYSAQDPLVKPITVFIQLDECPQYVSWLIESNSRLGILYAEYKQGSYRINQAFNNITEVVYVHPNTPLVFNLVDGEFCGVFNYAIFEGNNDTSKQALIIQGQERSLSSVGSVVEPFTLEINPKALSVSPSSAPTFQSNFELYTKQDPLVKPITVFLQLSDNPEYVEWSIKSVAGNVTYAQYNRGTYNSNQSSTNVTNVVYVHPNVPLEFSYYKNPRADISSYAFFEGDNANQGKELAIDRTTSRFGFFSAFFTLPEETLAPTPAPSMAPSSAPVTPSPTPAPKPQPTPAPLTNKEKQICENRKYFVDACQPEQQKYTNDLFVSSVTSIVFTSLTTAGILIGWLRNFWRKRRALARKRKIDAKKQERINQRNFHYHNHQHWLNIASHFKQQETKQKELIESLPEGSDRDEASRCAAWAASNAEYCFQLSNDHRKQGQALKERTSTDVASDEESGQSQEFW